VPHYLIACGKSSGDTQVLNTTQYAHAMGYLSLEITETNMQLIVRDRYVLSNLYVYVSANTITNTTTVRSRRQTPPGAAIDGNQSVSIPAGTTGAFADPVNADILVDGDLFCTQSVTPNAGVSITFTIISYILSMANNKPILAVTSGSTTGAGATVYYFIMGRIAATITENYTYYTFRSPVTLSSLRAYVDNNTVTATSTLRTRINGNNGNQTLSIPATATGAFEDTTNTDNVLIGQNVNLQLVVGATGTSITLKSAQLKSHAPGRQIAAARPGTVTLAFGTTVYVTIEGDPQSVNAVEADVQITARARFIARNMYVNISANTLDGDTTFRLRKSSGAGGNSNLVVTVAATLTGQFEDTTDVDTFVETDLLDWQAAAAGTAGSIIITCLGFEQSIPPVISKPSKATSKMVAVA
jgi:hypothetical protein